MQSVNQTGQVVCVQKPGLSKLCMYPSAFSLFSNYFCVSILDWGSLYIP